MKTKKILMSLLISMLLTVPLSADEITLVKHASRTETPAVNTTQYIVKPNDTLQLILMEVFGARLENMPYLYKKFRELNPNVKNLNYILVDQKLTIPHVRTMQAQTRKGYEVKPVERDYYIIKQGEHLAQILRNLYGLSDEQIFHEYLAVIKELNPGLNNLDYVVPGQKIRMPKINDNQKKRGLPKAQPTEQTLLSMAGAEEHKPELTPQQVHENVARLVKNTLFPAFKQMGGLQKDQGTYFMPIAGGGNITIDTKEIPVMELDTGTRIILDVNNRISPEVKDFIEKAFPSCKVIKDPGPDLEALMDRALSVSGYFSINKGASPLLIGGEEKVKLFGKWIVYKDFSRHNVFVINILNDKDVHTPQSIRDYTARFGLDLIELGGTEERPGDVMQKPMQAMNHSFPVLFDHLGITYAQDREIELVALENSVRITYKAPLMTGNLIIADEMPDETIRGLLVKKGFKLVVSKDASIMNVLKDLHVNGEGPPVRFIVAQGRTEIDLPGMQVGKNIILEKAIDRDIARYLTATGVDVLVW